MEELVNQLVAAGYLKTPAIIDAFKKIDRRHFVPEALQDWAYVNQPLSIGQGQTISQPLTVAFMLELLELAPGQKVLDVGTGSGWQAALLAELVGPSGRVISIERIESLSEQARGNLARYSGKAAFSSELTRLRRLRLKQNSLKKTSPCLHSIKLVVGDGSLGYQPEAPYDRIVGAAASNAVPPAWRDQLKIGGIIVTPIGTSLIKLVKKSENDFEKEEYPGFVFVPLIKDN